MNKSVQLSMVKKLLVEKNCGNSNDEINYQIKVVNPYPKRNQTSFIILEEDRLPLGYGIWTPSLKLLSLFDKNHELFMKIETLIVEGN